MTIRQSGILRRVLRMDDQIPKENKLHVISILPTRNLNDDIYNILFIW